jgi:hypothetical protein
MVMGNMVKVPIRRITCWPKGHWRDVVSRGRQRATSNSALQEAQGVGLRVGLSSFHICPHCGQRKVWALKTPDTAPSRGSLTYGLPGSGWCCINAPGVEYDRITGNGYVSS